MKTSYWEDIRQGLYNLFDHKLLEQGAYVNITGGQKNSRGFDLSKLYPVVDDSLGLPSGYIWQSAFHNWNYESGVSNLPIPIVASGVIINGIFTPKSSSIHIDYLNGRVIFDSAQSVTGNIQAAFAYKEYSFLTPTSEEDTKASTKYSNNSKIFPQPFAASPDEVYLPALFIEIEEATERGFQLGGTHETIPTFKVNIISDRRSQVEAIAGVLANESTRSFPIVAANLGPKFNNLNDLTENYSFHDWCQLSQNFAYIKSVKYSRFFSSTDEKSEPSLYGGVVAVEISAIR